MIPPRSETSPHMFKEKVEEEEEKKGEEKIEEEENWYEKMLEGKKK